MTQSLGDKPMTQAHLLELMQKMRSLVEPETQIPDAETVDWTVPHRLSRESRESLMLFSVKLAGYLEKCLHTLAGMTFEVRAEGIYERYANQLFAHIVHEQPKVYYMPVTQAGKSQVGYISLPYDAATLLVGCMLRDPESHIGESDPMTSLAESILLDATASLAETIAEGFDEIGRTPIQKTDRIVYIDWPLRFNDLEEMCELRFEAVSGSTKLTMSLTVIDEVIADIAKIDGPFSRMEERKDNPDRIVKHMHDAPMQVTAQVSSALMTLNDILSLEEGDVVILDRKIAEPVDVLINGQACFCAWPAAHAQRLALQIIDEKKHNL